MYLKKIRLQNIKCFEDVTLKFPHRDGNYGGWNVILGENGRGKSTVLRSIALGALRKDLAFFTIDQLEGRLARQGAEGPFAVTADLLLHAVEHRQPHEQAVNHQNRLTLTPHSGFKVSIAGVSLDVNQILNHAQCYGYGPFRRLEEGRGSVPSGFQFPQPMSRFVTVFTDDIGLVDATRGLIDLYVASVDPKHTLHGSAKQAFPAVCRVVDALLPGGVRLDRVTSEKVEFKTTLGVDLAAKELSDGYRSFLALVLDLLRHFSARFGPALPDLIQCEEDRIFVNVEALVLIDEADAHLHPSWQRELGDRLRRVFPKVQFIVTTHSPFVAQEATDGGLFVLRAGKDGAVTVEQPVESVRGWTASQILTSPLFGLHSTRAPETESLIRENSALIAKERAGKLTATESKRLETVQKQLTATLSAPGETFEEMQRQQDVAAYIDQTLNRLRNSKK
jgi:predicted ATP-binding protein involved in virulence